MKVKRYWAVLCPHCGQAQGMEVRVLDSAVLKCKYCNNRKKLRLARQYGVTVIVLGKTDDCNNLQRFIIDYRKKTGQKAESVQTKLI
jgi:sarcosine oxidase delta subunit|tara:strand:- start:698 stop:958 length:261 start_codon:yes stop_codon:yes gene_type:complete